MSIFFHEGDLEKNKVYYLISKARRDYLLIKILNYTNNVYRLDSLNKFSILQNHTGVQLYSLRQYWDIQEVDSINWDIAIIEGDWSPYELMGETQIQTPTNT